MMVFYFCIQRRKFIKKLKNILIGIMLIFSTTFFSEVAEVYQWKAFPGKSQDMLVVWGKPLKYMPLRVRKSQLMLKYWINSIS
ncbi:MAG: hypothetical protein CM15mP86_06190 [Gammaproteobacteria bacterium]|nr:MAG: hypothetical protein CM15mP86_06190 [Gammaproteobacteria bacterium]